MPSNKKQFIFFCGKGGVGKTTCAVSTSIKLSQSGYKTLLFSTDPAHSIADSLEQRLTDKVSAVNNVPNMYALEIDASKELKSFVIMYEKELTDFFKTVANLDNEDVNDLLLLTLPGIDELMAIKKIIDFTEQENDFTYFVCDTAPTGHALRLISIPDIANEWIKVMASLQWKYKCVISTFSGNTVKDNDLLLILKKIISRVKSILKNKEQTVFNIVTIPEAMAVQETKRLISSLNKMGLTIHNLIVNNIIPANNTCIFCSNRRKSQNVYLQELNKSFQNINIISKLLEDREIRGIESLANFSHNLALTGVSIND